AGRRCRDRQRRRRNLAGKHPSTGERRAAGHLWRDERPQAGGGYPPHLPEAAHDLWIDHGNPARLGAADHAARGEGAPAGGRPDVSAGAGCPSAGTNGPCRAVRQARPHHPSPVVSRATVAALLGVLLIACGQPTAQPAPIATPTPRHTPTPSPTPPATTTTRRPPPE